ncbi:metal ABC transporter permease [Metabacillus arenae]|uniref:Manganese transport system membrane protein MntC n=1 Tax=Metabacillus arenae TaxID=2771434 RepID=A0A926NEW0_9BACI|nr:metal ABC transporter permease [Metabacillus arenae]MBD1380259.1 metal ABC transporter permease [Metabacillus arenae]
MLEQIFIQLQNSNTQWVLAGTFFLGIASGVLGSFALLRKQSLIGDAMAHAALPGVCIAFILYGQKSLFLFLIGAAIAGLAATWLIQTIVSHSRIKEDTALGMVLSVFFGFGIVLLTYIQQTASGNKSGLDDFLFGQAASMVGQDVRLITIIALTLLIITFLFFKEFKLLTFDSQFAKGIGLKTSFLNGLLMTLIVCAVVIGLQTVGVILMAAMLITPAIAARYWTEKLSVMTILSGVIGGISGIIGTLLSTTTKGMATGPLIIVAATSIFLISLIIAPRRGLLSQFIRMVKLKEKTAKEQLLLSLYDLTEEAEREHSEPDLSSVELKEKRNISDQLFTKYIMEFEKKKWVKRTGGMSWRLTEKGLEETYDLALKQRLYEMYLMHEMEMSNLQLNQYDGFDVNQIPCEMKNRLFELLSIHHRLPSLLPKTKSLGQKGWRANEL